MASRFRDQLIDMTSTQLPDCYFWDVCVTFQFEARDTLLVYLPYYRESVYIADLKSDFEKRRCVCACGLLTDSSLHSSGAVRGRSY